MTQVEIDDVFMKGSLIVMSVTVGAILLFISDEKFLGLRVGLALGEAAICMLWMMTRSL